MLVLQQPGFSGMQPSYNPSMGSNPFQSPGITPQEQFMFAQNPAPVSQMSTNPSSFGQISPPQPQDLSNLALLASSIGQTLQGTVNALSSTATTWSRIFGALSAQQPGQLPPNFSQQPNIQMGQQQYSLPFQQSGTPSMQQPSTQFGQQQQFAYSQQVPGQTPNLQQFSQQPDPSQAQQQGAQVQSFGGMGNTATQHAAVSTGATPQKHAKANVLPVSGAQRKAVQSPNQLPVRFHKVQPLPTRHMFKMLHGQKLDREDDDDGW